MRIAVLTTVHYPTDGRIFHKQATSLARAGHDVTYFARDVTGVAEEAQRRGFTFAPLHNPTSRTGRPLQWFQLFHRLKLASFDVWHFHDPELLPIALLYRQLIAPHVKLIYDVHDYYGATILDKYWIPKAWRRPIAWISERIELWGMGKCDAVIAASPGIAKLCRRGSQNVTIVNNNPIILEEAAEVLAQRDQIYEQRKTISPDQPVRVVYVGNVTPPRGAREMVEAMRLLEGEPIEMVLVGLFTPQSLLEEIQAKVGSNVNIIGRVPFEQVRNYIRQGDIGLVTLHLIHAHMHILPTKLFEYMEAGIPAIVSAIPSWKEIVDDVKCGLVVDPSKPQEIADAIRRLVYDEDLRLQMGRNGAYAVRERYSWQTEERVLLKLYDELSR